MKGTEKINEITLKVATTFYDKQEEWLIKQMIEDMQGNPEKYKDVVYFPIERKKVVNLIKKGKQYQELEHQLAEKDTFIKELQNDNRELRKGLNKSGLDYFISSSNSIRHQVCQEIREYCKNNFTPIPHKLGCYVEVNREEFFDKLDQIEGKGETK